MLVNILIGIAGLIAIILIAALFIKNEYRIERDIMIEKNTPEVYDYVKFLVNQENYSKWVMSDPGMKKDLRGTDGTVGFVYAWDSQHKGAGKGEQEIKGLIENQAVNTEIRFEKPFEGIATTRIITEMYPENNTKVKWSMEGRNKYPMNIMIPFVDKMLGTDMEISLNNLKNILEKN
jgi:hypothetical protein